MASEFAGGLEAMADRLRQDAEAARQIVMDQAVSLSGDIDSASRTACA